MTERQSTAQGMISGMTPVLQSGEFAFATLPDGADAALLGSAIATFHEAEGLSVILPMAEADTAGLPCDTPMACITLNVYSALEGVGLTAAVATALAEAGIACNMVAAFHHDHAFVPVRDAQRALGILEDLQKQASAP